MTSRCSLRRLMWCVGVHVMVLVFAIGTMGCEIFERIYYSEPSGAASPSGPAVHFRRGQADPAAPVPSGDVLGNFRPNVDVKAPSPR